MQYYPIRRPGKTHNGSLRYQHKGQIKQIRSRLQLALDFFVECGNPHIRQIREPSSAATKVRFSEGLTSMDLPIPTPTAHSTHMVFSNHKCSYNK